VTDGREGVATFQRLRDVAARFVDVQLDYLGHCARDEKVSQSVMKQKILLDLDSGAVSPAVACLELLSKHIRARIGRASRNRFKDEPAHLAPHKGNTAKFFRTMLGEVKA
jgi:hypothetical protein